MSYHTGDDLAYETIGMVLIVSILISEPRYIQTIPLPSWITVVLTVSLGLILMFISHGRIFWAVMGSIAWVLLKLGIVHKDETEYEIEYDEEGKPHLKEKTSVDNDEKR